MELPFGALIIADASQVPEGQTGERDNLSGVIDDRDNIWISRESFDEQFGIYVRDRLIEFIRTELP